MRKIIFGILYFFFCFSVKSDPAPAYVFEVEVTHSKGTTVGYVCIGGIYDDEKQFSKSDTMFTRVIKQWNGSDSLYLYQEVYFIDSLNVQIYFKDKLIRINERTIFKIHMKKMITTGSGNWVDDTRFETKDLVWLKMAFMKKEEYFDFYCGYDVYYFEKVPANKKFVEISKLYQLNNYSKNYSEDELQVWSEILHGYFLTLKKYKVVIRSQCSC